MSCLSGSSQNIDMIPDRQRVEYALKQLELQTPNNGIGTYMERSQHRFLKYCFEPDTSYHEVPCLGRVADILREDTVTEIQTSAFSAMREKLEVFLKQYNVTIVWPCVVKSRIVWINPESGDSALGPYRRNRMAVFRVLPELLKISEYYGSERLKVLAAQTVCDDKRLLDGYGPDRKKRCTKLDRVPTELCSVIDISSPDRIAELLPYNNGDELDRSDFQARTGLKRRNLWCAVKFLEETGILTQSRKNGNRIKYRFNDPRM